MAEAWTQSDDGVVWSSWGTECSVTGGPGRSSGKSTTATSCLPCCRAQSCPTARTGLAVCKVALDPHSEGLQCQSTPSRPCSPLGRTETGPGWGQQKAEVTACGRPPDHAVPATTSVIPILAAPLSGVSGAWEVHAESSLRTQPPVGTLEMCVFTHTCTHSNAHVHM